MSEPPLVVERFVLLQDGLGPGLEVAPGSVHLLGVEDDVAVLEVVVDGAVGEAAAADADALEDAVARQLVQHKAGIDHA